MAFPSTQLDAIVQIALGADLSLPSTSWAWTDVTSYVFARDQITITRGRGDGYSEMPPSQARFVVDNRDGRWTRTNPVGAWYGQLARSTPVRIRINNGSGYVTRFTGYIDDLPLRWDKSGRYAAAQVTASGILRRVTRGLPLRSALYRTLTNGFNTGLAVAYWPGEDASGSTQVASGISGPSMQALGNISFAADSTIAGSDPLMQLGAGAGLLGTVPAYPANTTWALRFVCSIPTAAAGATVLADWRTPGGTIIEWQLRITPGSPDLVQLFGYNSAGVDLVVDTGASFVNTAGAELYAQQVYWEINATQNGTGIDWDYNFWFTAGTGAAGFGRVATVASASMANVNQIFFSPDSNLDGITIGHIGLATSSSYGASAYGANGYAGEQAQFRLIRIATEENLPWDLSATDAVTLLGAQRTDTVINQLRQIGAAEGTAIYEQFDGDLVVPDRRGLYNQAVGLTLDFDQGQVAESPDPVDDDQLLHNDITVSRLGGSSARAVQLTGPNSVTAVGTYADAQTLNAFADSDLPYRAQWLRHLGTADTFRYPQIRLNFARATSKINSWLACDIFSRIQLTNPPTGLPPDPIDLLLEGYTEVLGPYAWDVTLNCSSGESWQVFQLEDNNLGRIDTAVSSLSTAVSAGATALTVATSAGPTWSTTAVPYDISVGGERITVTAVANLVSDTFTRSVSSGWGTATSGQVWAISGGTAADFTVNGSLGTMTHSAVSATHSILLPLGVIDMDVRIDADHNIGSVAGGNLVSFFDFRMVDASNLFRLYIRWKPAGTATAELVRVLAGVATTIASETTIPGATSSSGLTVRMSATGTVSSTGVTVLAKAWPTSAREPGWLLSATDFTIDSAGDFRVASFRDTGNTNNPTVFRFDNLAVLNPQTFTVTRAVNGVSKAQTAGTSISLWRPGAGGLAL